MGKFKFPLSRSISSRRRLSYAHSTSVKVVSITTTSTTSTTSTHEALLRIDGGLTEPALQAIRIKLIRIKSRKFRS